jgi:hypothetical protein
VHAKGSTQIDGSACRVQGKTDGIEFGICTRSRGLDVTDHPGINRTKQSLVVSTDSNGVAAARRIVESRYHVRCNMMNLNMIMRCYPSCQQSLMDLSFCNSLVADHGPT